HLDPVVLHARGASNRDQATHDVGTINVEGTFGDLREEPSISRILTEHLARFDQRCIKFVAATVDEGRKPEGVATPRVPEHLIHDDLCPGVLLLLEKCSRGTEMCIHNPTRRRRLNTSELGTHQAALGRHLAQAADHSCCLALQHPQEALAGKVFRCLAAFLVKDVSRLPYPRHRLAETAVAPEEATGERKADGESPLPSRNLTDLAAPRRLVCTPGRPAPAQVSGRPSWKRRNHETHETHEQRQKKNL